MDSLAASSTGTGAKFYEQTCQSSQHAAFGNALLYFRPRSSWVRPFLSVGTGVVHFTGRALLSLHRDPTHPTGLVQRNETRASCRGRRRFETQERMGISIFFRGNIKLQSRQLSAHASGIEDAGELPKSVRCG